MEDFGGKKIRDNGMIDLLELICSLIDLPSQWKLEMRLLKYRMLMLGSTASVSRASVPSCLVANVALQLVQPTKRHWWAALSVQLGSPHNYHETVLGTTLANLPTNLHSFVSLFISQHMSQNLSRVSSS